MQKCVCTFFCVSTVLYNIHLCSLLPLISPLPSSLPLPLPLSLSLSPPPPPPPPSLPPSPHFSPYFISLPPPSPSLPPPSRRPTEATDSAPSPTKVARRRTKAEIARLDTLKSFGGCGFKATSRKRMQRPLKGTREKARVWERERERERERELK